MQFIKPDINIDFMGRRKLFLAISAALIIISLLAVMVRGLNYGIDFAGGMLVQVKFEKPVTSDQIRESMAKIGLNDATVQRFGTDEDNEFLIRSQAEGFSLDNISEKVVGALKEATGDENITERRGETVGPKAGKDLREKALLALFFSLLLMGVYISGRFEAKWALAGVMALVLGVTAFGLQLALTSMGLTGDLVMILMITAVLVVTFLACVFLRLRYATGAVVSTAHDAIVTMGIYCLLGREFNLSTVAALLTIIGFSVNDTIIIYDRIRENLRKGMRLSFVEVINRSINQTLSRTIITSGTLFIVVVILFVFGGGVIEDFALTMLIGVIVATYSSIYIASPIVLLVPETKRKLVKSSPSKPVVRREAKRTVVENESLNDGEAEVAANKVQAAQTTPVKKRKKPVSKRSRRR